MKVLCVKKEKEMVEQERERKNQRLVEFYYLLCFFLLESVVARNVDRDAITFHQLYITVYIYIYISFSLCKSRT